MAESSSSSSSNVETFVKYCDLCDVKMETAFTNNQHMNGKRHKAKVAAKEKGNTTPGIKRNVDETEGKLVSDVQPTKKMKAGNVEESKTKVQSEIPTPTEKPALTCDDCNLVFKVESNALQHFKGKKHTSMVLKNLEKRKAELKAKPECTICSKTFLNDTEALVHYQSKAHTTKLLASINAPQPKVAKDKESNIKKPVVPKENPNIKKPAVSDGKGGEKAKSHLHCEVCNMTFLSDDLSLAHFKGKKHNTKVTQTILNKEREGRERSNNWLRNNRFNTGGYGSNEIGNKFDKRQSSSNYSNRNQDTQQKGSYIFDKQHTSSKSNANSNQSSYDYQSENYQSENMYSHDRQASSSGNYNWYSSKTRYNPKSSGYDFGNMQSSDPAAAQLGNINNDISRLKGMLRNYESISY